MKQAEEGSRFNTDRLVSTYFKLSLPVVMGSMISIIYNLADTYFIAQTNNALLVAGVSVCTPIFTILMAFGNIFGQGGSSLLSRLLGQQKTEDAKKVSAFCFWIAILTGIIVGGLLLLFLDPFLAMLGTSEETLPYAREYATVLLLGAPFIVVNFIHMNLLRCEGMAGMSMIGTLIGAVVNIILDPLMIPSMGARGAALATVIGYVMTVIYLLIVVLLKSKVLSIRPILRLKGAFVQSILSIGATAAITNIASSLCVILVNQKLLAFGDDRIAAMGIVFKVTMIVQMIQVGFSFGGVPLFGYLEGAKEQEKTRRLLRFCLVFLCALSACLSLIVVFGAPYLLGLITPDENLIRLGAPMLRFQVSGGIFAGVVMLMTCLCQATGKAVPALMLSLSRQGVIYVLVLLVSSALFGYMGILSAQLAADILSSVLAVVLFKTMFRPEKE